jgi:hypothetical protein
MINVRLAGGLGNQLFQLAAALALSSRSDAQIRLFTGALRRYRAVREPDILRLLDLSLLNVQVHETADAVSWLAERARLGRWAPGLAITDSNFGSKLVTDIAGRKSGWLDGYFQTQWTAPSLHPVLRKMGAAVDPSWRRANSGPADVVIHIRGGDFLKSPIHQVVDAGYYTRALQAIQGQGKIETVLVITDDRPYAEGILASALSECPGVKTIYPDPPAVDPLEDFAILLAAPRRVIGNSTFSWWASALGDGDGTTVSPSVFARGEIRHPPLPWEIVLPVPLE